jgi:hypothetical protein
LPNSTTAFLSTPEIFVVGKREEGSAVAEATGMTVTTVVGEVYTENVCSEAGQLITPLERHDWIVNVAVDVTVTVVVASARGKILWKKLTDDEDVCSDDDEEVVCFWGGVVTVVGTADLTHEDCSVVKNMGTVVAGVGPHVFPATATVAPAAAPRAS